MLIAGVPVNSATYPVDSLDFTLSGVQLFAHVTDFRTESLDFRRQGIDGSINGISRCMPHCPGKQVNTAVKDFAERMVSTDCLAFQVPG